MMTRRLRIVGSAYRRMNVWDGDYHELAIRILDRSAATRWCAQSPVQNAAGFGVLEGMTDAAAYRRRWHRFPVKRRRLARRFMVQIEPLVIAGLVAVELDGERVRIRRQSSNLPERA